MKKNTTDELLKLLRSARSISELADYNEALSAHKGFSSFSEYMSDHLRTHQMAETDLIRASQIQRTYAYQILNGTKNPGRDKALALCLAAKMNCEETQRALTLADLGHLYPRRKRDSILIFALEQQLGVQQTNELLYEAGEDILN